MGAFPIKYLHGNAWTYYSPGAQFPKNSRVEVYQLDKFTERPPSWSDKPNGRKLPVPYISPYKWSLNFEPQKDTVSRKGTYLVRINAGNVKDQYLVHLY